MHIPAIIYGTYKGVRPRMRNIVRALAAGKSFSEAMNIDEVIDTRSVSGLFVLSGPSPLLGESSHFQCYLPHLMIYEGLLEGKLSRDLEERVFTESLETDWGTLLFTSYENGFWLKTPERCHRLVDAAARFWDRFEIEGPRYTTGLDEGKPLWSSNTCVHMALARLGVPEDRLGEPLPSGGIGELMRLIPGESSAI